MATLDDGFEADAREAFAEEIYREVIGEADGVAFAFVQHAHERLREYGDRFDMAVEPIIDSLGQPEVTRTDRGVVVTLRWDHPAAGFFEVGTAPHTIEGDPVLSFIWTDPPAWAREAFEAEGDGVRAFFRSVDHPGMPASRYIRDTIHYIREEIQT